MGRSVMGECICKIRRIDSLTDVAGKTEMGECVKHNTY